jgi:hypothetical protein
MRAWTRLLTAVAAAALAVPWPAWAEPISFSIDSLHKRPALVLVDTQSVTTLQFCRGIAWSAFKAPWLHVTVSPQDKRVLLLDSSGTSGETTLMVWIEGDGLPLQFTVRASPQEAQTHLYFVSCDSAVPRAQAPASPPAAPSPGPAAGRAGQAAPPQPRSEEGGVASAWDRLTASLSDAQWGLLTALIQQPSPQAQAAFEATLSRDQWALWAQVAPTLRVSPGGSTGQAQGSAGQPQAPPPQGPGPRPLPGWLAWSARVTSSGGGLLVSYTLQNAGQVDVVVDPVRLRVEDSEGAPLPGVSVSREDTSGIAGRITPGGAESGTIRVAAAPRGPVTIVWPVVAIDGSGTTYTVRDTVQAP